MSGPIHLRDKKAPTPPSSSVLGPADPRTLEMAAEILRERTMSLETEENPPAKRLVLTVVVLTILIAVALIVFRNEVRGFLGLT